MEPFGQGNPEPVFWARDLNLLLPPRVIKDKHIKLRVNQRIPGLKNSFNYEAMGWRMAERLGTEALQPGDRLDIAFKVAMNFHPEFGGLELMLEDFRKSAPAAIAVYSE
jgi:single-stranded-DNA-specific exonuclease